MVNSSLRKLIVGGGTGEGGAGRADQLARLLGFLQQLPRPRPRLLLAGAVLCTAGSHTFDWERARQAARDGDHWRDIERCREIRQESPVSRYYWCEENHEFSVVQTADDPSQAADCGLPDLRTEAEDRGSDGWG